MTFNEFIFSDRTSHRQIRHLTFWTLFGLQYYLQSVVPVDHMYFKAMISLICYFPACILSVYTPLHFMPLVQEGKYLSFAYKIALLFLLIVILNYLLSYPFYWFFSDYQMTAVSQMQIFGMSFINTGHAFTTGILILGFKTVKEWIIRQKENQLLVKQKLSKQLQFEKAMIYPNFIFKILKDLHGKLVSQSTASPDIILKLSDILSYILYDSKEKWVPIDKEFAMIENLLSIQIMVEAKRLTVHSQIFVNANNRSIKPLVLFPVLQTCFSSLECKENEHHHLEVEINTECRSPYFSLVGKRLCENSQLVEWPEFFNNAKKSLLILDQGMSELKIQDKLVHCKINLESLLTNIA